MKPALVLKADRRGVAFGQPRWDGDWYSEKLDLLGELTVPVVPLTFGGPTPSQVDRLHASGSAVWVTVTTVKEARAAHQAGADALIVQGIEAGGHRGGFDAPTAATSGCSLCCSWCKPRRAMTCGWLGPAGS